MKNKTLNVFSIYYHLHADLSSLDITRILQSAWTMELNCVNSCSLTMSLG